MQFKQWLEFIDPVKPKGVRKSSIVLNPGTNTARPVTQFSWKTSLGNVVKLHFQHTGPDEYTVIFYVNNTLFDDAPKNTVDGRDSEILPTVIHLLKTKADAINAKKLDFRAYKSENDSKVVRNLDDKTIVSDTLMHLDQLKNIISSHQIKMIPPSQQRIDLFRKLNRPDPIPQPDINQKRWLNWIDNVKESIKNQQPFVLESALTELHSGTELDSIGYNSEKLISSLRELINVFKSRTPEGFIKVKNRRAEIYKKLMDRHMTDKWNVEIKGDYFYLTRKD